MRVPALCKKVSKASAYFGQLGARSEKVKKENEKKITLAAFVCALLWAVVPPLKSPKAGPTQPSPVATMLSGRGIKAGSAAVLVDAPAQQQRTLFREQPAPCVPVAPSRPLSHAFALV